MKTLLSNFFYLFLLSTILLGACNLKDKFKVDTPQPSSLVNSTIIGIVKDEAGLPIANAAVFAGTQSTVSDINGIYIFKNVLCAKKATTIKFIKTGYFNGFKTISVQANQKQTANITLLKRENPKTFNASTGGSVASGNGIEITFPANSLINKNTGASYSGQANVFIKRIDPTTTLGQNTMPGELTGLTTNSEEKVLESFGMLAAEIEDNKLCIFLPPISYSEHYLELISAIEFAAEKLQMPIFIPIKIVVK
jgi:hypothetical protein